MQGKNILNGNIYVSSTSLSTNSNIASCTQMNSITNCSKYDTNGNCIQCSNSKVLINGLCSSTCQNPIVFNQNDFCTCSNNQ